MSDYISEEERAFFLQGNEALRRRAERKKKSKVVMHDWNRWFPGRHKFNMLYIPAKLAEVYGGEIALPQQYKIHMGIKVGRPQQKQGLINMFPHAEDWNALHVDEGCLVCPRREHYLETYEAAAQDGNEKFEKIVNALQRSKAKEKVAFVGVNHWKDKEGSHKRVELFILPQYWWEQSMDAQIIAPREQSYNSWVEEHEGEEEFVGLSDEELEYIWRTTLKPKFKPPWHMIHSAVLSFRIKHNNKGQREFEVEPLGVKWPYKAFAVPEKAKNKEAWAKLAKKGKANMEWLKEQFEAGLVPDLKQMFKPITVEEQRKMLGIEKEQKDDQPSKEDTVEVLGNKADDAMGEERAKVDLDELPDEPEKEEEIKEESADDELLEELPEEDSEDPEDELDDPF